MLPRTFGSPAPVTGVNRIALDRSSVSTAFRLTSLCNKAITEATSALQAESPMPFGSPAPATRCPGAGPSSPMRSLHCLSAHQPLQPRGLFSPTKRTDSLHCLSAHRPLQHPTPGSGAYSSRLHCLSAHQPLQPSLRGMRLLG